MIYSSAGFLALIIQLIINHDVLWASSERAVVPAHRSYRAFLIAVSVYFVTDILWGLLYEHGLTALTYFDTAVYFAAMGASILLWTRYVIDYLKEDNSFSRIMGAAGWIFFIFQMLALAANFFLPVLYSFDAEGNYHAEAARYVTLGVQIAMFLMTGVYAFIAATRREGTMKLRHRTIGIFSLAMAGFIAAQTYLPLLPMYAIGCMLGTCVLHSFVMENEKEEYREQLETRLEENILKGNYYDLLTGLPGMSHFFELAQAKRAVMKRMDRKCAFLYMNLRGLKFYNQSHGFSEGDRLLRSFAQLLIASFGDENCSRFGRDHFVVLAEDEGLENILKELFHDWETLYGSDGPSIHVGIYPDTVENVDIGTACDLAKIACDALRQTYISAIKYYDTDMLVTAQRRQYIISHLDQAIAERWIQVYYQPIVRAVSGQVCDEEALARWIDPEKGFLSPGDFIPILEEANLIYKLDLCVVEQVLEKLKRTRENGLFLVPQSINLSRSDFDTCDIVEEIVRRVDAADMPHSLLTIEITESVVGSDFDFIIEQAKRFQALGFPVWMDDFGSGYSSLDVLQRSTFDLIKLDMRFMQQFDHGDRSKIILTELMKMAIGLGIDTVCEGVEREDQVEFLKEIGCSKLQGFYFSHARSLEDILDRYANGRQIGFENPEEFGYFDAIGRVNLYDLAVIAQEDEDSMRHYFNTVPMAILEVRGDQVRFSRCNQAYRDFMRRDAHMDFTDLGGDLEQLAKGPYPVFTATLKQCCKDSSRAVFDETLRNGSAAHFFMRRIAENALTGTMAVAVAVLAITDGSNSDEQQMQG